LELRAPEAALAKMVERENDLERKVRFYPTECIYLLVLEIQLPHKTVNFMFY
jgi:hypothetical protein